MRYQITYDEAMQLLGCPYSHSLTPGGPGAPKIDELEEDTFLRCFILTAIWDHNARRNRATVTRYIEGLRLIGEEEARWIVTTIEANLGDEATRELVRRRLMNASAPPGPPPDPPVPARRRDEDLGGMLYG